MTGGMDKSLNVILYEPGRLMYVTTPKCGSSSMVNLFLTMAGFDPRDRQIRKLAWAASADGRLAERGLSIRQADTADMLAIRAEHPDHRLMANIRNPYDRVLSNYFNKLNRYAKRFDRPTYRYGKLRQFLEGPKSWPLVARGNAYMQRRLGFQALLDGLDRHGVGFDAHYALQCELLALDRLTYDRLFRLETLDADFRDAMAAAGLPARALARLRAMPRNNRTEYRGDQDRLLTPEARAIIARLYAADFAALGYPV